MVNNGGYKVDELNHLHKVQLMILEDFIKICNEHDIKYTIYAGSLIGAVRHGGFIPWDDDIDVVLLRNDFNKLLNVAEKDLNEKYELLTMDNQDDYFLNHAKISLKGTKFNEYFSDQISYQQGIFIDVFALDNLPENNVKRLIYTYRCIILRHLVINSAIKVEGSSKFNKFIHICLHALFKNFLPFLKNRLSKLLVKYDDLDATRVIEHGNTCGVVFFYKEDYENLKTIKFESLNVTIPINFDRPLSQLYGDYMKLPPENERVNHSPDLIDFGEY